MQRFQSAHPGVRQGYLNLHENFIKKAPSADLWQDQSDESELGFSYELIDTGLKALEKNDEKTILNLDKNLILMLKTRLEKYAFKRKMPNFLELNE